MPPKPATRWLERKGGTREKWEGPFTYRQKIKHGKTVHVCWEQAMHTFFQEMLGGVGRLQENVGVTLFLKDKEQGNDQLSVVPDT